MMSIEYAAYVSPAYEDRATREHAMSVPGGDAHGDSGGSCRYDIPRSATKRDHYATTSIGGTTHGDGDGESSSGADRSAAKPIDRNQS
jgi:hypothetical protein